MLRQLRTTLGLCLVLVAAPVSPAAAQQSDLVALIRVHYVAWNSVNPEAVLDTFADDVVIDDNGTVYSGPDQVRGWVQRFVAPGQNVVPDGFRVDGQHVAWKWTRLGDATRQRIGVPEAVGDAEALIAQGKITFFRITLDRAANARLQTAYQAALAAAMATRTAEIDAAATVEALATRAASSGILRRVADTQERRTPALAWWMVGVALSLVVCVGLAVFQRPPKPL